MYFGDLLDTCDKTLSFEDFHVVVSCALHATEQHMTENKVDAILFIENFYRQFMPMIELIQIIIKKMMIVDTYIMYILRIEIEYRP